MPFQFPNDPDFLFPDIFRDFAGSRFAALQLIDRDPAPPRMSAEGLLASPAFWERFAQRLRSDRVCSATLNRWRLLAGQLAEATEAVGDAERELTAVQEASAKLFTNGASQLAVKMATLSRQESESLDRVKWARAAALPIAQEVARVKAAAEAQCRDVWRRVAAEASAAADAALAEARQRLIEVVAPLLGDLFEAEAVANGFKHNRLRLNPATPNVRQLADLVGAAVEAPREPARPAVPAHPRIPPPEPPPAPPVAAVPVTDFPLLAESAPPSEPPQDIVTAFVDARCLWGSPEYRVRSADLWGAFCAWCAGTATGQLTRQEFGALVAALPGVERFQSDGTWYRGLDLRPDDDVDPGPAEAAATGSAGPGAA